MPSVTPSEVKDGKEGKKHFLDKCFHALKEEGKPQEQRIAQCLNMWKQGVKKNRAKGSLEDPRWEDYETEAFVFSL